MALMFAAVTASGAAGCGVGKDVNSDERGAAAAVEKGVAAARGPKVTLTSCKVGEHGAEFTGHLRNMATVKSDFNVAVVMRDRDGQRLDWADTFAHDVEPGQTVPIDGLGLVAPGVLPDDIRCEVMDVDQIGSEV
ncbi:MAG: hypothetical protein GXX79_15075 [Actinomycetales bacterium]|nr:hypothetical protein [Actinomycetales bacterium]